MNRQLKLHRQLQQFLENFKKLGRSKYTPAVVRSRIQSLKELWQRFDEGHVRLKSTIAEENRSTVSYFYDNFYESAEDAFYSALDHLGETLEELEPSPSSRRSVEVSHVRASPSALTMTRLPPLQLTPFNGNIRKWESFRDCFTVLILNNPELSDLTRMHYLISFTRGHAQKCLTGLAISAENFHRAWQILKEQYEDKRRLISIHMSTLLSLPYLSRESAEDLWSLINKVRVALASLARLQRTPEELWNDFLVHLIVQNLDDTTRRDWFMRKNDGPEPPSFECLDRFLSGQIRFLESL